MRTALGAGLLVLVLGILGLAVVIPGFEAQRRQEGRETTTANELDEPLPGAARPSEGSSERPHVQVGNSLLSLEPVNGRCAVTHVADTHRGSTQLEMTPPCAWVLDHRHVPRMVTYGAKGADTTVLVAVGGAPAHPGPMDPVLATPCGTQAQGILVRAGRVEVSRQVFQGSAFCPSAGMDEKMFWLFAHEESRNPPP